MERSNVALHAVDYDSDADRWLLYRLLAERRPHESIAHARMPSYDEHCAFMARKPYEAWYIVNNLMDPVGSVYLTKDRAIGVAILRAHHRKGHAKAAVEALIERHPGPIVAHVNAANVASRSLWERLGWQLNEVKYQKSA